MVVCWKFHAHNRSGECRSRSQAKPNKRNIVHWNNKIRIIGTFITTTKVQSTAGCKPRQDRRYNNAAKVYHGLDAFGNAIEWSTKYCFDMQLINLRGWYILFFVVFSDEFVNCYLFESTIPWCSINEKLFYDLF